MMKEYIEKELLKERFLKWLPPDGDWDYQSMGLHPIENIAVSAIMEIEETPAADVREVVHAKWVMALDDFEDGRGNVETPHCTNCGTGVYRHDAKNYCPYCGAKMDKE